MNWDLGLTGVAVLAVMSAGFGVFAQLVFWRSAAPWMWLAAWGTFFVGGLFISEVLFGWATEVELQPNIDGLSFDEVLIGYLVGVPIVLALRYATRTRRPHSMPS